MIPNVTEGGSWRPVVSVYLTKLLFAVSATSKSNCTPECLFAISQDCQCTGFLFVYNLEVGPNLITVELNSHSTDSIT